eukprot:TRINITY_DN25569_c0_g1_i1.p1 TRINITY_DN25569_c0_g1~~TRINITY_DN25569_c0_g1_i1.p1  ORF type:complete len:767 (+),score=197.63 TRINITY_DN25569_c0_g1_i1:64-2364(+)
MAQTTSTNGSGGGGYGQSRGGRPGVGPSAVPPLGLAEGQGRKAQTNKDEVDAILNGLMLDKNFFVEKLRPLGEVLEGTGDGSLAPPILDSSRAKTHCPNAESLPVSPFSKLSATFGARGVMHNVLSSFKESKKKNLKKQMQIGPERNPADFDVYLNEALMPVLAQSLDSLCRQINRMEEQGDNLDPKVRARFNPLTFLGQQLLRRHPACARTPRRQALYKDFKNWSDFERGRREMLRRKDIIQEVFGGFELRGGVQQTSIMAVIAAVDDTFLLDGCLKKHHEFLATLLKSGEQIDDSNSPSRKARRLRAFFSGEVWNFDLFWRRFSGAIINLDVVPFSVIKAGAEKKQREARARAEREQAERKEAELRKQAEVEERREVEAYREVYDAILANEHIQAILNENKILTGDDVRPGDAGYEFEVPPKGEHCVLIGRLLVTLGFKEVEPWPVATDATEEGRASPEERWWTAELANAWTVLQDLFGAELADGVVERDCLEQALVEPSGIVRLKRQVEDELEREENEEEGHLGIIQRNASFDEVCHAGGVGKPKQKVKASFEELSHRLGMTMARLKWLHELFVGFLQGEEEEENSDTRTCGYPENPAALEKAQMKALMQEVRPGIGEDEFQARFKRIDEDSSGLIEFDEFVIWVREDEVRIVGASSRKMSLEELAEIHVEPIEVIRYLHGCFQDQFPEGTVDDYPRKPAGLPKHEVKQLLSILTPDMTDEDFETSFHLVDINQKERLDFDEFLEVIDLEELPRDENGLVKGC